MKKLILLLAAVALATSVWAQDTPKKPSFAGFVSNGFWDNWEITLGGGAGTALSNGTNQGSFGDRINFEANFGLTKWFHPVTGMRLQLQGGQFANFDDVLGKAKWPYLFVHADFMLNFSNWAGGYREDRAYYAVPFAGFGYMASNFTDKSHENNGSGTHQSFAFTLGWLNKFRISPSFDFNIELKGLIAPSRVSPVAMDGSYLFGFSATAGFTYRFNKRGWQRGVAGYTVADIQAFQDAVAASMAAAASMEMAYSKAWRIIHEAEEGFGFRLLDSTIGGRHGGGAFSGKDCTKVDRSAAYAARWVAKNVVAAGLADRCEVELAYAIGVSKPLSIMVDTFGTAHVAEDKIVEAVEKTFDLRPGAIIRDLDLRRPIYEKTAAYGHFGREDADFTWEKTDRVEELKAACGL